MRVIVPFGPRKIMGFVIAITAESAFSKLKPIEEVLDLEPVLTKELLDLGKWLAHQTLSLSITVLQIMLPQVLKSKYKKEIVRVTEEDLAPELEDLFAGRDILPFEAFEDSLISYYQLQKAIQSGEIKIDYLVKSKITKKYEMMVRPKKGGHLLEEALIELPKSAKKQYAIIDFFIEYPEEISQKLLLKKFQTTNSTIKTLVNKNLLETYRKEVYRNPFDDQSIVRTAPLDLTDEQSAA